MNDPNWDVTRTLATAESLPAKISGRRNDTESVTMTDLSGTVHGMTRHGIPRPPRDIEHEMSEAGRTGDTIRLGLAHAAYVAWLRDVHGIIETVQGNTAPPEVFG